MADDDATNPVVDDATRVAPEGVADEAEAQGEDQLTDAEAQEGQAEDDSEEIEYEGAKHRIPKALKPALMMQADYTRKTQELAEHRRALETEAQTVVQQRAAVEALRQEYGQVEALRAEVQRYENVDWATWFDNDYAAAQAASVRYQQVTRAADQAERALAEKESQRLAEVRSHQARAVEEAERSLKTEIPDWGPAKASTLQALAVSYGYPSEQFATFHDPRAAKLLNDLATAKAELATLKTKRAAAQKIEGDQQVRPAAPVKGSFAPAGLHDNLSSEEWVRRRNAQLAKRA